MNATIIEHFGYLKKLEMLTTLKSGIEEGTLVLEAPEPFPGCATYYGELPRNSVPLYVYLLIKNDTTLEKFVRANQAVSTKFPETFNGAFAAVEIQHETFKAIRIRHLKSYSLIKALQLAYQAEGISFITSGQQYKGEALITIKKLFQLNHFDDGFYCDEEELDHGYFEIPQNLDLKQFNALIRKVKNNTKLQMYDFARAFFYTHHKVVDVIRVYNPEMNQSLLRYISQEVLSRME